MSAAELEALKLAIAADRYWEGWCEIALIAGLFGEVLVAVWFREGRHWLEVALAVGLAAVVAFAVWGAFRFGSSADHAADVLQRIAEEKVADLNNETERLHAQNLTLEALVQPRRIPPEYEVAIRDDLASRCGGTKFRLSIPAGDGEAAVLAFQIFALLKDAQWDDGGLKIEQRPPGGPMVVGVRLVPAVEEPETAYTVYGWLKAAGIWNNVLLGEAPHPSDRMEVRIGVKPLPDMFEPKPPWAPPDD